MEPEASDRLERFAQACPLYARLIEDRPDLAAWLESPETRNLTIGLHTFLAEVEATRTPHGVIERTAGGYPGFLRRFRRKAAMRIAYRDVAGFVTQEVVVEELTRLAEMMIRECYFVATLRANARWGEPWDHELQRVARFSVLGLGKLGGRELNFSSDVDLIYLYEGEGNTRRAGKPTGTTNVEYFQKVAEDLTGLLNARDGDGFLFRADLRLRPGGATAALAPSVTAAENYYAATGQTWERLALLKARVVAGDFVIGGELLESLHSFRYPRHPPAALLTEVAAMKQRTENEVVGYGALARNVKSGYGGIREIEFLAQVLQLLHAGRFPFLQTHSTTEALRQLVRYGLLAAPDARFLTDSYWFLRRVEHRLQMAEEQQTHELPTDPAALAALACSLGFPDATTFEADLDRRRERIRRHYADLFASEEPPAADAADPWWPFFADERVSPAVRARLEQWFGTGPHEEAIRDLRLFVRGDASNPLVREQVQRFAGVVPALDRVLPRLARPRQTLRRISAFAERYATRNQFFAACSLNREFLEVIALLFDRSHFIAELLTRHPEILEEVLRPEILRKRKNVAGRRREMSAHGTTSDEDYIAWLTLYVRAEQVRAAIGHLLGFVSDDEIGGELTGVADAALLEAIARTPGAEQLLVIALGKFGGAELSYGSDLDIVVIGGDGGPPDEKILRAIRGWLGGGGREPAFTLDLRLRPHGDSGPLGADAPKLSELLCPIGTDLGAPAPDACPRRCRTRGRRAGLGSLGRRNRLRSRPRRPGGCGTLAHAPAHSARARHGPSAPARLQDWRGRPGGHRVRVANAADAPRRIASGRARSQYPIRLGTARSRRSGAPGRRSPAFDKSPPPPAPGMELATRRQSRRQRHSGGAG